MLDRKVKNKFFDRHILPAIFFYRVTSIPRSNRNNKNRAKIYPTIGHPSSVHFIVRTYSIGVPSFLTE